MSTKLHAYLNFEGNARQAMVFYQSVFGGELTMSTFKEFGLANDPRDENRIMHSFLHAGNGIELMGADTMSSMAHEPGARFALSLSGENEAELRSYFEKLSAGGSVDQPLLQAPWGDTFGMLHDPYGVEWMVNITAPQT